MDEKDRSAVLYAVANTPTLGFRLFVSYLRMKRAARRAEDNFYRELLRSGLPKDEARRLADEYGSAFSVRNFFKGSWNDFR